MNEDLSKEMPEQPSELAQILAIVQEVKTDIKALNQRVSALEDLVEVRAYDTRPLWDRISGELDRLNAGQEELRNEMRSGLHAIHLELTAIRVESDRNLKKIDRRFDQVFGSLGEMRAQISILEDRMDKVSPEA